MDKVVFTFVSSVGWKRFPDGTEDDQQYYKENLTDYDPNEDHICGGCGKPLRGRFLFCNSVCEELLSKNMEISHLTRLLARAATLLKGARCQYKHLDKPHSPRCTKQATHFGVMNEGTYIYLSTHCDEHINSGLYRQTVFTPKKRDLELLRIDEILAFATDEEEEHQGRGTI
jgi:predicted nucleic acid-binding Zn ribbon protein